MDKPKYSSVDEYINQYDGNVRKRMERLRGIILASSREITEKISWGMPTFVLNGNLVHFAAGKHHIGFYPSPDAITAFKDKLCGFKYSKGAIQFPNGRDIPYELVEEIVLYRVKQMTKDS